MNKFPGPAAFWAHHNILVGVATGFTRKDKEPQIKLLEYIWTNMLI
jgi:hypothetical protein